MVELTPDSILTLAPDASSAKNARGLATPTKWPTLHATDHALWGECQGSGKHPYLTAVDLRDAGGASKCSCPSRKFPCKHALALMLLRATHPGHFGTTTPPDAIQTWLTGRSERAEKKTEKATRAAEHASAPAANQRRAARDAKVTAGLDGLALFLRDLIEGGLAAAQHRPYSDWDTQAARLIDAQAPGAARLVRHTPALLSHPDALLMHLGRLHLLCRAWANLTTLTPEEAQEVRSAVGYPFDAAEILAQPPITTDWHVLGQLVIAEDHLTVRRTWLHDATTNRDALLLDFAPQGRPLPPGLMAHTTVHASVHFPATAHPQRALLGETGAPRPLDVRLPERHLDDVLDRHAAQLARNPWLERSAHHVTRVRFAPGAPWHLVDARGQALPLGGTDHDLFRLHALGGGQALTCFGEWDGAIFTPLSLLEVHHD
ncbi:SWIM zinc finger family protein [Deinococcus maricopensis]|uniref:SWIM-type domain-containing protein n=1 Tax=Deinococcus maricopensis (strain DSM 21211 / LMG 22137 / NRRL B-23946 / LB-34) TaxID=709986 RepID=E8U5K1_DEIML|nr:SWIM zinc finger family protein [Deinococcus maricopensis]ADV66340.1 hypothetical protein Deima_0683 [Deinococcus maricopensis DSM 21211]